MTINLNEPSASLIILDIEGTTTPIDFVYKTLSPFARERVEDYLNRDWDAPEVQTDLAQLRAEWAADAAQGLNPPALECESPTERLESMVAYIHWLMDRGPKIDATESDSGENLAGRLRGGRIARRGLRRRAARVRALALRQNKLICIYSSGSALAQKLLFAHTTSGDLTYYICRYFDTTIGHKIEVIVIGGSPKNYGWP